MDVNTELAPFRCALMHVIWSLPKNLNDQKATVIAYFLNLTSKEFRPAFYTHQCLTVFMNVFIDECVHKRIHQYCLNIDECRTQPALFSCC